MTSRTNVKGIINIDAGRESSLAIFHLIIDSLKNPKLIAVSNCEGQKIQD